MKKKDKFIDVEKVIAQKNPKLLRRLPKFVLRYLKRIIHEKEINDFLEANKDKKNQEFCSEVVDYLNITFEVENIEKIPDTGNIVIAMNHPLGGMDAMILVQALKDKRMDVKFIVNDILLNLENLKEMFVGVDKVNRDHSSLRGNIDSLFSSKNAVCIFPAGMVSRRFEGKVQDYPWKKTFVNQARKNNSTIVPIFIDGRLSRFFYGLARLRMFLGIKSNIEMLYLSNELFKQKNKHMKFIVGDPISQEKLHCDKKDKDLAAEIRQIVYNLDK